MKLRATLVVAVVVLSLFASATSALADGTETLGEPTIPIAAGSGFAVAGAGTFTQPAAFSVTVPDGATVKQVLLYWEGYAQGGDLAGDASITLNGQPVEGTKIGGETRFSSVWSASYRADITSMNLVGPGTTELSVDEMDFTYASNGAGVIVIYDDGSGPADIQLRDGVDLAYYLFAEPQRNTVPQTYTFDPAPVARTVDIALFMSGVAVERPNALEITIDGVTSTLENPFLDNDGAEWDTFETTVELPAGATTVTVQPFSRSDGSGRQPASLAWVGSFLSVPEYQEEEPPPPPKWCPKPLEWWKKQLWMKLVGKFTKFEGSSYSYDDVANASSKDPYWNLASEYIALELNRLWGADSSVVKDERAEAKQLLGQYLKKRHKVTGDVKDEFNDLADLLEEFNSGALTPGCDVPEDEDHGGGKDHDGKDKDKGKHDKGWGGWGRW